MSSNKKVEENKFFVLALAQYTCVSEMSFFVGIIYIFPLGLIITEFTLPNIVSVLC